MNVAIASVWRARSLAPVWSGLLIITCGGWGVTRMQAYSHEPLQTAHKVTLLQGSIDQYQKWDSRYVQSIQKRYEQLVQKSVAEKPALIVWPETSVPGYLLQDPPLREWLFQLVRRSKTAHLVGAPSQEKPQAAFNSAFSLNAEARIVGQYDKQHLVPFGEIVPWRSLLGRWVRVLNDLGGFTAGRRSPTLASGIGPVGVNICYEAIFPDLVRQSVLKGAGVVINLTNDGWYMQTAAPYQHFIPNVFRAVENDRWVLRADNTGVTGLINPRGKVVAASPIFSPTIVTGLVVPRRTLTPYTRYGDVFPWTCLVFCLLFWLRAILRRKVNP